MMILINETDFDARLFRTVLTDDVMVATLVAKVGYAIGHGGSLERLHRQPTVLMSPAEIDGACFPPDAGYGKQGVDVLLIGSAHVPSGRPHRVLVAGVTLGEVTLSVAVIGDRRWQKRWPGWVATDPQPFVEMPLAWANAYGGRARVRGAEIPHVVNPNGKGYVLDTSEAEGTMLPNVENCLELIREITDQPQPVSFCPLPAGMGLMSGAGTEDVPLTTAIYNSAIAQHRLDAYPAGQPLRLHNLMPGTATHTCALPTLQLLAEVTLGGTRHEFRASIDTITVLLARRELLLTHRVVFRYDYTRGRPRTVRLRSLGEQGDWLGGGRAEP